MIEEMLLHESSITLDGVWLHGPVFIEVEGDYVFEGEAAGFVKADEFIVNAGWGAAGGEAQDDMLAFGSARFDEGSDLIGYGGGGY